MTMLMAGCFEALERWLRQRPPAIDIGCQNVYMISWKGATINRAQNM